MESKLHNGEGKGQEEAVRYRDRSSISGPEILKTLKNCYSRGSSKTPESIGRFN